MADLSFSPSPHSSTHSDAIGWRLTFLVLLGPEKASDNATVLPFECSIFETLCSHPTLKIPNHVVFKISSSMAPMETQVQLVRAFF
jgi:hypothetical protein